MEVESGQRCDRRPTGDKMGRPAKPSKRRPRLTKSRRGRDGQGGDDKNVEGRPALSCALPDVGAVALLMEGTNLLTNRPCRVYVTPSRRLVMVETL